jgi:hypothetical protein
MGEPAAPSYLRRAHEIPRVYRMHILLGHMLHNLSELDWISL